METPFHLLLTKVFHAYRGKTRMELPTLGLSPGQPKVLRMLARHNGILQKELAALCDIEPATVSRLLDSMEQIGLVERMPVPGDRRALRIQLTDRGQEIQRRAEERYLALDEEILFDFSSEERKQLTQCLLHLYRNLKGREID